MADFKDNFSQQSGIYARYRPLYPEALYSFLFSLTEKHDLAWDCGTGNGQAAIGLAAYYDKIIATDASEQQIKNCFANKKITYLVEAAEHSPLPSHSADLLTIANALHWLNFDVFFNEAKRVLKTDAVIAAWAYHNPVVSPEIDEIINQFHDDTLNDYWLPENRLVEKKYAGIPFPFKQIVCPEFHSEKMMNLDDVIGLLNTWSATQSFIRKNKFNPTTELKNELKSVWGHENSEKKVTWKLILKVGRNN